MPKDDLIPLLDRSQIAAKPDVWAYPTPHMPIPEIKDLCLYPPLMEMMQSLTGEKMMIYLNPTGWVSTEREWHQAGKQAVQPLPSRAGGGRGGQKNDPGHGTDFSEYFVRAAIDIKGKEEGRVSATFLGKKGDVLIWHGRLVHRGYKPSNPKAQRKVIISHYSATARRLRFPSTDASESILT